MAAADSEFLREARKVRRRVPEEIFEVGSRALGRGSSSDESWAIREQVLLAAVDRHDGAAAASLLKELEEQFPGSQRVLRLRGLYSEWSEDFEGAAAIYAKMLEANKANTLVQKRQVCLLKAQGKTKEAIAALNKFTATFQADAEAWQELAELYLRADCHKAAAFCCEELILVNPQDYLTHLLYAEVLFTLGNGGSKPDNDSLRMARKYFSQSLVLKRAGNARALWGLATTACALGASRAKEPKGEVPNTDLHAHAVEKLRAMYEEGEGAPEGMAELVRKVLEKQSAAMQQ